MEARTILLVIVALLVVPATASEIEEFDETDVLVEPAEVQIEPAEAKIEPAEAKIEPAEAKIEPAEESKIEPAEQAKIEPAEQAKIEPAEQAKIEPAEQAKIEPAEVQGVLEGVKKRVTAQNLEELIRELIHYWDEEQTRQRTKWPSKWPSEAQPAAAVAEAQPAVAEAQPAVAVAEAQLAAADAEAQRVLQVQQEIKALQEAAEKAKGDDKVWKERVWKERVWEWEKEKREEERDKEEQKKKWNEIEKWNGCLEQTRGLTSLGDFISCANEINYKVHIWSHEVQSSERRVRLVQELLRFLQLLRPNLRARTPIRSHECQRHLRPLHQLNTDLYKLDTKLHERGILKGNELQEMYDKNMCKLEKLEEKLEKLEEKLEKLEDSGLRRKQEKLRQEQEKLLTATKEQRDGFCEKFSEAYEELRERMIKHERKLAKTYNRIGNGIHRGFNKCLPKPQGTVHRSGNRLNGIKSTDNAVAALMVLSLAVAFMAPLAFVLRKSRQNKVSKRKTP